MKLTAPIAAIALAAVLATVSGAHAFDEKSGIRTSREVGA